MIKMQAKMGDELIDYLADKLLEFVKSFYESELNDWSTNLQNIIKKILQLECKSRRLNLFI